MNRQERLSVWTDEVAHPGSPTTWYAMQATGANPQFVDEWRDVEGQPGESDWMTYLDFLKGAIGIASDHDPKTEFDTPIEQVRRFQHIVELWGELSKVTSEPHNEMGEDRTEYELWKKRYADSYKDGGDPSERDDGGPMHGDFVEYNEPSAITESIIDLPGELYVRYDPEKRQFLGFGFTPVNDSHPGFSHIDGPEPGCDLTEFDNPVWAGMREYLQNVMEISGECAFAVQWTEDGWRVK